MKQMLVAFAFAVLIGPSAMAQKVEKQYPPGWKGDKKPAAAAQQEAKSTTEPKAVASPSGAVEHVPIGSYKPLVQVPEGQENHVKIFGRNKDTKPWRVEDLYSQDSDPAARARIEERIEGSTKTDEALRKAGKTEMEPVAVRDAFFTDIRSFKPASAAGHIAIIAAAQGMPAGYIQGGGLRNAPAAERNAYIGIVGMTVIQGFYRYEGKVWQMTLMIVCGNKSGICVIPEVVAELEPPEVIPPERVEPPTIVPEPAPKHVTSENEVIGGIEQANLPAADGSVGDIKVTREFVGYRKTWVRSMFSNGSLLRVIAQGGLENIEKLVDTQSEEHLGGRLWTNAQVHLVIDDLTLQFGVGGSYSKDGLASAYVEPAITYDPRYWGIEANYNVGVAPSKELSDGDVTTLLAGAFVKPLQLMQVDDRIPVNWRLGVMYRDFDLDRPEDWRYHTKGWSVYSKVYFEFGRKFEVDHATGWAKQKSVWSFYAQLRWGFQQDVEVYDQTGGRSRLIFNDKQDLEDGAVVLSYKW